MATDVTDDELDSDSDSCDESGKQSTYFIQQGDSGPIKIGIAVDIQHRLAGLQTASPYPLRVLGVIRRNCERELHLMFRELRLSGEWFRNDKRLVDFILTNAEMTDGEPLVAAAVRCIEDVVAIWKSASMQELLDFQAHATVTSPEPQPRSSIGDLDRAMVSLLRVARRCDYRSAYKRMIGK